MKISLAFFALAVAAVSAQKCREGSAYDKVSGMCVRCPTGTAVTTDDKTGDQMCCRPNQIVQDGKCVDKPIDIKCEPYEIYNAARGYCEECPIGTVGKKDTADPKGKEICCEQDQTNVNGQCIPPKPPKPDPAQPGGICSGQAVCNRCRSGELGIKYGSCYTMQFPEGGYLGRDRAGTDYKKDGYFSEIPYKICAAKDAACAAKKGRYVKIGEDFSMMDTLGLHTDAQGKPGWVGNQAGGAHKLFVYDANTAGVFRAKPGCLSCSVCFMGLTTGIGMACPVDKPGFTEYANPNICQQFVLKEVNCADAKNEELQCFNVQGAAAGVGAAAAAGEDAAAQARLLDFNFSPQLFGVTNNAFRF